jgi:acyl phosphate:glycerol-3-phosphate acyltransferase
MFNFIDLLRSEYLLLYLFAYGWAAIPTSFLVSRIIYRTDLKKHDVKSHTASYLYRNLSKRAGLLVFLLDVQKGLLPCAIGSSLNMPLEVLALAGVFAVLGHCFSIWLKFFGGHGGATAAGSMLIIYWPAALIILITNYCLTLVSLSVGLSTIVAIFLGLLVLWMGLANKVVLLIVFHMAVIVIIRHWLSTT